MFDSNETTGRAVLTADDQVAQHRDAEHDDDDGQGDKGGCDDGGLQALHFRWGADLDAARLL